MPIKLKAKPQDRSGSVTLLDVARAARVSLKTASRVLNGSSELRPETAARVHEVMNRLGYRPNEMARGLKAKRSAAIAMIAPNFADPFTATAVQAVQDVAREHQHVVILASSGGDVAMEKSELEVMARRQIDGVILIAASSKESSLKNFQERGVPVAVFDEPILGEDVDTITVTNRKSAQEATGHLLMHGYKKILAVGARPHLFTCAERVAGYRAAIRRSGIHPIELLVRHENELTADVLAPFVSTPSAVDAILSLNWVCTMLILRELQALKKAIPSDVAFLSFDDFELSELIPPGVTVVRQPTRELGRQAAKLLFERIEERTEHPPRNIVLNTEFVIRGSCGCTPKA